MKLAVRTIGGPPGPDADPPLRPGAPARGGARFGARIWKEMDAIKRTRWGMMAARNRSRLGCVLASRAVHSSSQPLFTPQGRTQRGDAAGSGRGVKRARRRAGARTSASDTDVPSPSDSLSAGAYPSPLPGRSSAYPHAGHADLRADTRAGR